MAFKLLAILSLIAITHAQRAGYAGFRPVGYPSVVNVAPSTTVNGIENKFGVDDASTPSTTTQRLPVEARGDRDLVDRISKLPIDQQPFWYINWKALEAHRQKPQTWPLKPNPFIDRHSNQFNQVQ